MPDLTKQEEIERISLGLTHREYLDYRKVRRKSAKRGKHPVLRAVLWIVLIASALMCLGLLLLHLMVGVAVLPFTLLVYLVKLAPVILLMALLLLLLTH